MHSEIGLATNLKELYIHSNQLSGIVPTEIGLLTALQKIVLSDNVLTSTVPTELANLALLGKGIVFCLSLTVISML
jgi:Leucine-rich repeat (LRR) protein